ncbi:MAG: TetR family transcriptional regulator C-terminal domain-containing protein [Amphritea sp.]
MNRPKRNEHNRELILEKGMELFNQQGYHGTGLKEILDACQVPKGSFYNYFSSKEQFAVEVLEYHHLQETEKWQQHHSAVQCDRITRMRLMLSQFIEEQEQDDEMHGCLLTNLMGEIGNASDSFREIIQQSANRVLECIEADFLLAQREGVMRTDMTATAMAHLFWDAWQGALLRTKVDASTAPMREVVEHLFNLFQPQGSGSAQY